MPFGPDPFAKDRAILDKDAFGPTKGPATPAITIVEFGDLECPACKQAQPVIEKLMSGEPKVKLIFQNYPLGVRFILGRRKQPLMSIASGVKTMTQPGSSSPRYMSSRMR